MAYRAEWHIPYRVMATWVWDRCTPEDLDCHTEMVVQFLTEAQIHAPGKMVYNLHDSTGVSELPPTYLMVTKAAPTFRFSNRGAMYHVARDTKVNTIMRLTAHVMRFPLHIYTNRDEAVRAVEAVVARDDMYLKK